MVKRVVMVGGWLLVVVLLAACGGSEQKEGIELESVGGSSSSASVVPTETPIPAMETVPAAAVDAGAADAIPDLTGRLLIMRGGTFELYDLASGETTIIEGERSSSPAFFSGNDRFAAYSAFPDFGVLDVESARTLIVENTASNPTGFSLSPDGQWMVILTGQITNRVQIAAVDNSVVHNVATSSTATFSTLWTRDSRLLWWRNDSDPAFQIFDPVSGENAPLDGSDPEIVAPVAVSPDGTRAVAVPVAFAPNDPDAAADACFDSYVEMYAAPFTLSHMLDGGTLIWTENGLVASSPQWLDSERLLFVKLGTGSCGDVQGVPERMIMLLDTSANSPQPEAVAGPLGNADDANDRIQASKNFGHLYTASPDGRYVAWIGGGRAAQESVINLTDLDTGETIPLLRSTRADALDAAGYIENGMFRQVLWLE